jgi:hypothetical protein
MGTLRDQLFQEFAQMGINESIAEFRRKLQVKKGDRFNYKGITYEIGPASVGIDGIEFEISSKIPQDELSKSVTLEEYFKEIKKIMTRQPKKPLSIDKENIIREMGDDEVKERDYVKLRYRFKDKEVFKTKVLVQQASDMDTKAVASLPVVPGVQTVAGRLVLLAVRDGLRDAANETMDHLIEANEQVRQTKLKKSKKKK